MSSYQVIGSNGIEMAYWAWGAPAAPPMVLLHALALVIGGGPDSHIPQDRVAELARRIPAAQLVTIPAGHLIHRTEPDLFTQAVLTFLR